MAGEWIVKECGSEDAHPYDSYGSGYKWLSSVGTWLLGYDMDQSGLGESLDSRTLGEWSLTGGSSMNFQSD